MRRALSFVLASGILLGSGLGCYAQTFDTSASGGKPVRGQVSISREVNISPSKDKVSLNLRDTSLRDVLSVLAQQGHFNILLDESVEGNLTVDIQNISVNKALEYVFTVADLSYTKDGNTVIVASKTKADEKNLTTKTLKAIPVLYKDAARIAAQLNSTIFKVPRPGGSTTALAASDPDSNSLLIMGTDADIKLVGDTLRELDVPRNRKVYHIKHNSPSYVAQVLMANFFQNSNGAAGGATTGAGGAASGAGAAAGTMAGMGAGGTGTASGTGAAGGGATGGAGGSGGGTTGQNNTMTSFTSGGVTFVAEPITATLTVMATDEQLALIDSIIDQVDKRRPQVEIEVSLVEIQNSELKTFVPGWGAFKFGKESSLQFNGVDADGNHTGINLFSLARSGFASTGHILDTFSISQSHQTVRGKVLANPTIVAMDGTESKIDITDQVPSVSQTTTVANGVTTITNTITTQEAGVQLSMLPTIYNDGSVELKMKPEVSQPIREVKAGTATTTLISKRSMDLAGVRIKDGQTLVIGGLLREKTSLDISKVPGIDKLPIVRAMFNATNGNNKDRTELVLMVTPHILKDDTTSYFDKAGGSKYSNPNQGGIQPISLPKFIGPFNDSGMQDAVHRPEPPAHKPIKPFHQSTLPVPGAQKTLLPPKQETVSLQATQRHTNATDTLVMPAKPAKGLHYTSFSTPTQPESKRQEPRLELLEEVLKN